MHDGIFHQSLRSQNFKLLFMTISKLLSITDEGSVKLKHSYNTKSYFVVFMASY